MKILISLFLTLLYLTNALGEVLNIHEENIQIPSISNFVTDNVGHLTKNERNQLTVLVQSIARQNGPQIHILTVNDLQGHSIDYYASECMQKMLQNNPSNNSSNDHILILIAKKERKTRIEIGEKLKVKISDSESSKIVNEYMIPEFRNDRFYAGLKNAIWAIAANFNISPAIGSEFKNLIKHRAKIRGIEQSQFNIALIVSLGLIGLISFFVKNSLLKPAVCATTSAIVFHFMLQTAFLTIMATTFGLFIGTIQILNKGISKLEYVRCNIGFNGRKSSGSW